MANRTLHNALSLDRSVVSLFGVLTFGGSGAIASQDCNGFSVARTGTGAWTITFSDRWSSLLGAHATYLHATTADGGKFELVADNVNATAKTLTAKWVSDDVTGGTFAPIDPASGAKVFLHFVLRNTATARKGL